MCRTLFGCFECRVSEVVPSADALSKLGGGDRPAHVGDLICTGGVGAARTFEFSATADRANSGDPAPDLLGLGHLGSVCR